MLKSYLKKQKEEEKSAGPGRKPGGVSKPSKDKPGDGSDSDDDSVDFKNLKVSDAKGPMGAEPRRHSLNGPPSSGGPVSPVSPGGQPRQRRQSFDAGSNASMVKDAMKDVNQVLGAVAEPKARPRRGSIH
jgi:hypothetical protein